MAPHCAAVLPCKANHVVRGGTSAPCAKYVKLCYGSPVHHNKTSSGGAPCSHKQRRTLHHFALCAFTTAWSQVKPWVGMLHWAPLQEGSFLSFPPCTTEATVPICDWTSCVSSAVSAASASSGYSCGGHSAL